MQQQRDFCFWLTRREVKWVLRCKNVQARRDYFKLSRDKLIWWAKSTLPPLIGTGSKHICQKLMGTSPHSPCPFTLRRPCVPPLGSNLRSDLTLGKICQMIKYRKSATKNLCFIIENHVFLKKREGFLFRSASI